MNDFCERLVFDVLFLIQQLEEQEEFYHLQDRFASLRSKIQQDKKNVAWALPMRSTMIK